MKPDAARGFSLIELMVTVAIVAIIAAVAIPSYRQYIRRANRTDATDGAAASRRPPRSGSTCRTTPTPRTTSWTTPRPAGLGIDGTERGFYDSRDHADPVVSPSATRRPRRSWPVVTRRTTSIAPASRHLAGPPDGRLPAAAVTTRTTAGAEASAALATGSAPAASPGRLSLPGNKRLRRRRNRRAPSPAPIARQNNRLRTLQRDAASSVRRPGLVLCNASS